MSDHHTSKANGRWWLYNEDAGIESVELRGPDFMLTVFDIDRLIADLKEARRFLVRVILLDTYSRSEDIELHVEGGEA